MNLYRRLMCIAAVAAVALASAVTADALPASYYAGVSRLASGRWVKVRVTTAGIHEVSYEQLRQWGFNDPSRVGVYGYSVPLLSSHSLSTSLPDDLPAVAVIHGRDRLLFYGDADVKMSVDGSDEAVVTAERNLGDLSGYYFLSDCGGDNTATVQETEGVQPEGEPLRWHTSVVYVEPEEESPLQIGALFYSEPLTTDGRRFTIPVRDVDGDGKGVFRFAYVGTTDKVAATPDVTFDGGVRVVTLDGGVLRDNKNMSPYNAYNTGAGQATLDLSGHGTQGFDFVIKRPAERPECTYLALDWLSLSYHRLNRMAPEGSLRMFFPTHETGQPVAMEMAPEGMVVWDVTDRTDIRELKVTAAGDGGDVATFALGRAGESEVIAFDPEARFEGVEFVGEVEPQNLHGMDAPEMIIITNGRLMEQAGMIAGLHRRVQGMDVCVVDQQKIFNEFSSGARHVDAYRRFAKMFHDRRPGRLRYILLVGDAYYDNRGIKRNDVSDNLMTFPTENVTYACNPTYGYTTDSYFGMLTDNVTATTVQRTPINVAVGRIPAADAASVERYIAKLSAYLETPPLEGSYMRALLIGDRGNENGHLLQAEALSNVITAVNGDVNVTKAYSGLYKTHNDVPEMLRNIVKEAFAGGQGYMCYMGHGGRTGLSNIMTIKDVAGITFGSGPVTFLATCDTYLLDSGSEHLAGEFLLSPSGPPAVIAAGRTVYMDNNKVLSEEFARQFYAGEEGDCVGDVYRRAHNNTSTTILSSEYQRRNNMCYNLAGDPALPVYRPARSVSVSAVNDVAVGTDTLRVYPVEPVVLSGVVRDANGAVDENFTGEVYITLYDAAQTLPSLNEHKDDTKPVSVDVDEYILGQYTAKVRSGRWRTTVVAPEPLTGDGVNRLSLYARSTDNVTASGSLTGVLSLEPSRREDSGFDDTVAPVIASMYLNTPSFTDGSVTGEDNLLVARILPDESGINFANRVVGASTRLLLDGNRSFSDARGSMMCGSDGSVTLRYNISNLAAGEHVLELSVADNSGNRSSRRLSFRVVKDWDVTLVSDVSVAREGVTFDLRHSLPEEAEALSGRLFVVNGTGETVYTRDNCRFPLEWDLRGSDGSMVPDGSYRVYAALRTSSGVLTSTPAIGVTVIAPMAAR